MGSGVELVVGKRVTTPSRYTLKASRISVLAGAVVASDVYYNQLTNVGTIGGTAHTPLPLPVVATLPPFETATTGTQDVTVG